MSAEFVHLHLHTDYSLLDGACHISWSKLKEEDRKGKADIVSMASAYKMPAVAITDHGVMGGAMEFYKELSSKGIKPIIGCETYVAPGSRFDKTPEHPHIKGFHLVLLAADKDGYANLCELISEAHLKGFYYKPRIDKEILAKHSKGLIALSACLQGEVPAAILDRNVKGAKKALGEYLDIFGKGNFFLEVMDHGIEEQRVVNKELVLLSREFDVPLVATNDVHYLKKEHAKIHDLMLCVQTRSSLSDEKRMRMTGEEFYFKSPEEMAQVFGSELPDSLKNTVAIAERCDFSFDFKQNHYPVYQVAQGTTQGQRLREICLDGFKRRYGYDLLSPETEAHKAEAPSMLKRLDYELGVIDKTKYSSYFLVVWDFINAAKEIGVPVGPGRGSGAGSLVAFLTGITDIDPIRYQLLFERFLNPERVSPPDFDIDFCERRREEVIRYVTNKYGADCVSQIGTYGTLKAKAVVKDIARVMGRTPAEGDMITKLIPADPNMTLHKAKEQAPDLRALLDKEAWVQEVFKYAEPLEGLNRNMGIHAAGVIIGDQRLAALVPLGRGAHDEVITQLPAGPCESLGLLKMDFLGLRTLTVIQDAIDNIKKSRDFDLDWDKTPLDDPATYKLLNKGDTIAVFQLESTGMQNLCRQFGVETIEHIIALIAIYRPGPMEFIPSFVARKMGSEKIEYDHPKMEPLLRETYGIMLYQEQIMQVVQEIAGFSLGGADILRRAIGKKKLKEMEEQKDKFVKGCAEANQIGQKLAEQIWEKINKFAGYGFNKSHSAAYAFLAYRTAYLKANYPEEFMAAVLTSELDNSEKLAFFINECREMGIKVLPPDVNGSDVYFTVDSGSIRFGLGAIKGLGQGAAERIIASHVKEGSFKSMVDLLERVGDNLNSKAVECLVRAGAMDSFGLKRSQLVAIIDTSIACAHNRRVDRETGQGSLFDMLGGEAKEDFGYVQPPDIPEFDANDMLKDEKQLLGFYVSGHPLAKFADLIKIYSSTSILKLEGMKEDEGVKIGGIVKSVRKKFSKKDGKPYAIMQFEDLEGSLECAVYGKAYEESKEFLLEETPIFVEALTRKRDEQSPISLGIESIMPLEQVYEKHSAELHIHVYEGSAKKDTLSALRSLLSKNPGKTQVVVCVTTAKGPIVFIEASRNFNVRVTKSFLNELQSLLGERRYKLKADKSVPQPRQRYQGSKWKEKEEEQAS